ncbi:MAG: hypothetical protein OEV30_05995 [Ignavibacteria bacterium]|nr:hypothetical protein [Ignavibacteria bacterium]
MKFVTGLVVCLLTVAEVSAQSSDTTMVPPPTAETGRSKVFYGGTVGVSFGSYFRLSLQPMVGYNFTPKISGGVKAIYEYINDSRFAQDVTWHNFGGSVFGRYRFVPQAYLHTEFVYMSYDSPLDRFGVPFLLVGGGYIQQISPNAGLYVEVLVDVLQNSKSPYDDWTPFISIGAAVGL